MTGKLTLAVFWFLLLTAGIHAASAQELSPCDQICGKWMSDDKNLSIQVYRDGDAFKAKIIWFDDSSDKTRPMETRTDSQNPDKNLCNRKILGSSVLENMVYKPTTNSWENGVIYDASHGKYWNSAASITPDGQMKVTGYWHFKWIGKTLTFSRIKPVYASRGGN